MGPSSAIACNRTTTAVSDYTQSTDFTIKEDNVDWVSKNYKKIWRIDKQNEMYDWMSSQTDQMKD